jgi:hypothetical protein
MLLNKAPSPHVGEVSSHCVMTSRGCFPPCAGGKGPGGVKPKLNVDVGPVTAAPTAIAAVAKTTKVRAQIRGDSRRFVFVCEKIPLSVCGRRGRAASRRRPRGERARAALIIVNPILSASLVRGGSGWCLTCVSRPCWCFMRVQAGTSGQPPATKGGAKTGGLKGLGLKVQTGYEDEDDWVPVRPGDHHHHQYHHHHHHHHHHMIMDWGPEGLGAQGADGV